MTYADMDNLNFLTTKYRVEILYQQFLKNKNLIIAVDFDSTIFPYHENDQFFDFKYVINKLIQARALGMKIVVYSCSSPERYGEIREYCSQNGLTIDGINCNLLPQYEGKGKIYYNLLLDDKAGLGQALDILVELIEKIK